MSPHGSIALLLGLSGLAPGHRPPAAPPVVRPGLEVLLADSVHLVRGRRVALVTNQAGVDHRGHSGVEVLRRAGVHLVALMSPEHGFRGAADPGAPVASTTDAATGLPIYSLYGADSVPADTMLAGVDLVLVDLQDAGARYYTYLWTTVGVMRAAAAKRIPVVILDRPNPIGGGVQGNVLDTAFRSPVGLLAVPMRHGMTLGELALLARHDLGLTTDLTVVPVRGWRRAMYFDATGLPFVPPSPNLRRLEALIHYPGLCLFEGTTLSVGRGTDRPFEQVGAPWVDTAAVLPRLRALAIPGVSFTGVRFTPRRPGDGKFDGVTVSGIRLRVTDRATYDPVATALALLAVLAPGGESGDGGGWALFPGDRRHLERLWGRSLTGLLQSLEAVGGGAPPGVGDWGDREGFLARRRPFLIYAD